MTTPQRTAALKITKTISTATIRAMRPPRDSALRLPFGSLVRNALSGRQYRVGELLGSGSFGVVYSIVAGERLPANGTSAICKRMNRASCGH